MSIRNCIVIILPVYNVGSYFIYKQTTVLVLVLVLGIVCTSSVSFYLSILSFFHVSKEKFKFNFWSIYWRQNIFVCDVVRFVLIERILVYIMFTIFYDTYLGTMRLKIYFQKCAKSKVDKQKEIKGVSIVLTLVLVY